MATLSLYAATAPVFTAMLDNLSAWLDKAEAHANKTGIDAETLLTKRLADDMLPLSGQISLMTAFAKNTMRRLAGEAPPDFPDVEKTLADFRARIARADAVLFVTPEYNRSVPGALKNAIDWAYKPFMKKAVAYVSYGSVGGARAVEHLRLIMTELQAVSVRHGVHIGGSDFMPVMMGQKTWDDILPAQVYFTKDLLDNLLWWTNATKAAREKDAAATKAA